MKEVSELKSILVDPEPSLDLLFTELLARTKQAKRSLGELKETFEKQRHYPDNSEVASNRNRSSVRSEDPPSRLSGSGGSGAGSGLKDKKKDYTNGDR